MLFILRGVRLLAHRRNLTEAGLLLRLTELRMLHRRLERRARLFCLRLLHRLLALRSLCGLLVLRCGVPGFGGRLFVILIAAVQRCFVVHVEVVHDTDLLLLFAGTFRSLC